MVQIKSALGGIPIRHVMITDFRMLAPQDPLANAVEHILAGFQEISLSWKMGAWSACSCVPT